MADKKVAITCEGFKARRQKGNGFEARRIKRYFRFTRSWL